MCPATRPNPHARQPLRTFMRAESAQGLVEVATVIPILFLLMAYAVDFGYFFIASASITSAARDATEYSIAGYQAPGQTSLPAAGPMTSATSVAGEAVAGLASYISASTTTTVQVCSKANGVNGKLASCTSYGPAGTAYTPAQDPEAPTFILQRVDVTYTVHPPIPLSFYAFSYYKRVSLLPSMQFHRQVSMRAMD